MSNNKCMISRNEKIKLFDISLYGGDESCEVDRDDVAMIVVEYKNKKYRSIMYKKQMDEYIDIMNNFKNDLMLDIHIYDDSSQTIYLEYHYLLRMGDVVKKYEHDLSEKYYKYFNCVLEKNDFGFKISEYYLTKFDEVRMAKIKLCDKLIKNIQIERNILIEEMRLFERDNIVRRTNESHVKLYGYRDDIEIVKVETKQ